MRKYENVDVIAALGAVMEINTANYKSDFKYDIEMFRKATARPDGGNNRLLWFSRKSGTECFRERDVLIAGTPANTTWKFHADTRDSILAYAVEITGRDRGKVIGNLYELDYREHVRNLKLDEIPIANVVLVFADGTEKRFPMDEYEKKNLSLAKAVNKHGNYFVKYMEPESEDALQKLLTDSHMARQEHTPAVFKLKNCSKTSIKKQLNAGKHRAENTPTKPIVRSNKLDNQREV